MFCSRDEKTFDQDTVVHSVPSCTPRVPQLSTIRRFKPCSMVCQPAAENGRSGVPCCLRPHTGCHHCVARNQEEEEGGKAAYANRSSRHQAPLKPGQVVTAQHVLTRRWDQRATVLESRDNGQSYHVRINGRTYLRNRRFLCPNRQPSQTDTANTTKPPATTEAPQGAVVEPKKPEEPQRSYPTRVRRQRVHYQAAKPKKSRRN